jgi:hypothetical protein
MPSKHENQSFHILSVRERQVHVTWGPTFRRAAVQTTTNAGQDVEKGPSALLKGA